MTLRAWRRILWLTLVGVVPLPLVIVGPGTVPVARMWMLGAITTSVMIFEQPGGAAPPLAALFFLQGLIYAALLWGAAVLLTQAVARAGAYAGAVVAVAVALLIASASLAPWYVDPYQSIDPRTDLLHVYR